MNNSENKTPSQDTITIKVTTFFGSLTVICLVGLVFYLYEAYNEPKFKVGDCITKLPLVSRDHLFDESKYRELEKWEDHTPDYYISEIGKAAYRLNYVYNYRTYDDKIEKNTVTETKLIDKIDESYTKVECTGDFLQLRQ